MRAIVFLAKQGVAFHGKAEDIKSSKNSGNFLTFLKSFAETNSILHDHLYKTKAKNTTHLSPSTQNEIINRANWV